MFGLTIIFIINWKYYLLRQLLFTEFV